VILFRQTVTEQEVAEARDRWKKAANLSGVGSGHTRRHWMHYLALVEHRSRMIALRNRIRGARWTA